MKFSLTILTCLFLFLISCNNNSPLAEEGVSNDSTLANPNPNSPNSTVPPSIESNWDSSLVIGNGVIWRERKDNSEDNWDKVHVTNIFGFKNAPVVGSFVQVIPLNNSLPSLKLKITKASPRDDLDTGSPQWYEVELESIQNKSYFDFKTSEDQNPEYPVDVILIASEEINGSIINELDVSKETILPEKIDFDLIKAAIDFGNDDSPEALVINFCCKDKSITENCEYRCEEIYLRYKGAWKLINSSQPM